MLTSSKISKRHILNMVIAKIFDREFQVVLFTWFCWYLSSPQKQLNNAIRSEEKKSQKQPSRLILTKRCSEKMQQIHRRIPMPKCNFNEVAKQDHKSDLSYLSVWNATYIKSYITFCFKQVKHVPNLNVKNSNLKNLDILKINKWWFRCS